MGTSNWLPSLYDYFRGCCGPNKVRVMSLPLEDSSKMHTLLKTTPRNISLCDLCGPHKFWGGAAQWRQRKQTQKMSRSVFQSWDEDKQLQRDDQRVEGIQGSRKRDKVGWQEFLNHLLKKRITVRGKKWHSLLEIPKNRKAKRTNVRTLGHRKCYDSDSPGKPWRRWGTAILNARIYLDLQMGGRGLGWTVGEGGAEERNGLTEPLPRACLFTAHHRHWGWAPAILKTHLTPSCSSCLMLPSIAICYLEGWTSLFPRNFPCSDLTFWELELTNNWYPCSYYRTKQTLISFVFILIIRSSNSCVRFIHLSHMEKEKLCLTCAFGGFHVGSHRRQNWYLRDAIQGGSDNRKQ